MPAANAGLLGEIAKGTQLKKASIKESDGAAQAKTMAALNSGKAKDNLKHGETNDKSGLTDAAKQAYLDEKAGKTAE